MQMTIFYIHHIPESSILKNHYFLELVPKNVSFSRKTKSLASSKSSNLLSTFDNFG